MSEYNIFYRTIVPIAKRVFKQNVPNHYNINDIIITPENQNLKNRSRYWTEEIKRQNANLNKWRATKTTVIDGVKYCTGDIITNLPDHLHNHHAFNLQHSYTCHSLQGQTFSNPSRIFMCPPSNYEMDLFRGYCYTAISRLEYIDQLCTIIPDIKID